MNGKYTRRAFIGTLAAGGAAAYLDSCGGSTSSSGKVNLTLSVADYDSNMRRDTKALVDEWNSKNPSVFVNLIVTNWGVYHDRLVTWVSGNRPPDIANVSGSDYNFFRGQGVLVPLTGVVSQSLLSHFVPAPLKSFNHNGQQYALPYFLDPRALYYRTDLFANAGLPMPVTWDDIATAGKRLTGNGIYGYGLGGKAPDASDDLEYKRLNAGVGAPRGHRSPDGKFDFNSQYWVRALTFLVDAIKAGYTNPSPVGSDEQEDLQPVFLSGKLAMLETGSWFWSMIEQQSPRLKYGIAPLPVRDKGETSVTTTQPDCVALFKTDNTTKYKAQTGRFLEYMFNRSNRLKFANQRGVVPERTDVGSDPAYLDKPQKKIFVNLLPNSVNEFADEGTKGPLLGQALQTWVQKAYLMQVDPKTALDQANAAINKIYGLNG